MFCELLRHQLHNTEPSNKTLELNVNPMILLYNQDPLWCVAKSYNDKFSNASDTTSKMKTVGI